MENKSNCPFEVGEIVVFKSYMRFQEYISRVLPIHIERYGHGGIPEIRKATIEEKEDWFKNDSSDLVIRNLA